MEDSVHHEMNQPGEGHRTIKSFAETCLQAYVCLFQELFAIQDVFTQQVFVFANCEQVSGITCQHDALIKGFAFNDMHEPNLRVTGTILVVTSAANP